MHVTKKLALGLGTAALSLALVGGIAAAAFTPADAQAQDEKGKPPVTKLQEILGKLVLEGKLSAEQSATIIARLEEVAKKVEEKRPAFSWKGAIGNSLKNAATFLGMTEKDLMAALREGKSLADLATSARRAGLIAAIAAPANAKVDEALAANKITAEQAAKAKAEIAKHVEALVDRKHEAKPEPKRDEKKPEPKRDEKKNDQRKEEQKTRIDVHKLLGSAHRVAAEHLGLDEKALGEQLRSGKSLAEIAGTDTQRESLIAAISKAANAKLGELKAAGKLTEVQAVAAEAQIAPAVAKIVDAKHNVRKVTAPGQAKKP